MILTYGQRDPKWATKKIGQSILTMGRWGCTITSIADLCSYFKPEMTPAEVCDFLKYTKDGLILWQSCDFKNFKFERREYTYNKDKIFEYLDRPGKAVILEVDHSHWVCALRHDKNGILVADPWTGGKCYVPNLQYKNITGASYFISKQ